MKRLIFLIMGGVLSFLTATNALALSCMWLSPEQATHLYLVRLKDVDYSNQTNTHYWTGMAGVDVLKVYRGDANALQRIDQVKIMVGCDDTWGPQCPIIPAFAQDQYWILVEDEKYEFSIQSLWHGRCSGYQISISNQAALDKFEQTYTPQWVSPQFSGVQE